MNRVKAKHRWSMDLESKKVDFGTSSKQMEALWQNNREEVLAAGNKLVTNKLPFGIWNSIATLDNKLAFPGLGNEYNE